MRDCVDVKAIAKLRRYLGFDKVLGGIGAALSLEAQSYCHPMGMNIDW
jgi:hypothetical protein